MVKLILSRLLQGVFVLFAVSLLVFALLATAGGDALSALRNDPVTSEETINGLRHIYGLDQPLMVRYARWLVEVWHGRLGHSFHFQAPVLSIVWPRLLRTGTLAVAALAIAWSVAITLGAAAARRAGSWVDRLCTVLILLAASTPRLLLALVALALTARTSFFTLGASSGELSNIGRVLQFLPPALVLSIPLISLFLAQTRASMTAVLGQEFVRAARARGLPERIILLRHVLRPALNPLITIFGYSLGSVVSGSVIVESVMGWPGLGQLSVIAVQSRDVSLLLGTVIVTSTAVLAGNLLADILLRLNDPRLR